MAPQIGNYVKVGRINLEEKFMIDGIIGKVIYLSRDHRKNTGDSDIVHVLTPAGMEYEVNITSKEIQLDIITEHKYFHELIKFPTGIFP